jgi:2-polyprenyl-6-methoxyphenol hydroxylase-like FAD-dependent oxidoreductase
MPYILISYGFGIALANHVQIGGSISGLMCGIMLKHHGYTVTILEKEDLLSRQGFDAGISIRDEVISFLKKHDRVKRDITITCPPGTLISVDGKPVAQRGQTMNLTSWPLLISVLRANFDGMTSKAVPAAPMPEDSDGKAVYMSKTRVMGIEEVGDEVQIEYEDLDSKKTDKISASLIIVADGSNSSTRGMLIPDVKRTYAGYMLWRGTTSEKAVDPKLNELYSGKFSFSFHKETYSPK